MSDISTKRTNGLWAQLIERRQTNISPEELRQRLAQLAEVALEEGNFYHALNSYMELKDKESIRKVAEAALEEGDLYDALNAYIEINDKEGVKKVGEKCIQESWHQDGIRAFEFLKEREGLSRIIQIVEKDEDDFVLKSTLWSYLNEENIKEVKTRFDGWTSEKGIKLDFDTFQVAPLLNLAYNLNKKYDIGIGIAKGGLFLTYLFNLFGLPVKIAHCHRRGKSASFNWMDIVKLEDFKGKKLAVFDKDVVSGRTTKKVLKEIQSYYPDSIDLILIHNPVQPGTIGIGTVARNIPEGYNKVYWPNSFNYQYFAQAIEGLEQKLRGS